METKIRLYQDDSEMIASDGVMKVEENWRNINRIKEHVRERNKRFEKYMPHKICNGFARCDNRWNVISKIISI